MEDFNAFEDSVIPFNPKVNYFTSFDEFRSYAKLRNDIRVNALGLFNSRVSRIPYKKLKGYVNQMIARKMPNTSQLHIFEKELEFKRICLDMKAVFTIDLK